MLIMHQALQELWTHRPFILLTALCSGCSSPFRLEECDGTGNRARAAVCSRQRAVYTSFFWLLPLCPPQLSDSVFPSSLVLRIAVLHVSSRNWHGLGVGMHLGSSCSVPLRPGGSVARRSGQESGCQETLPSSFYICLLCSSPSSPGCLHPPPPSFSLHTCLQLQFC